MWRHSALLRAISPQPSQWRHCPCIPLFGVRDERRFHMDSPRQVSLPPGSRPGLRFLLTALSRGRTVRQWEVMKTCRASSWIVDIPFNGRPCRTQRESPATDVPCHLSGAGIQHATRLLEFLDATLPAISLRRRRSPYAIRTRGRRATG